MITVWFALVVLCWVLFFVLEGFDFGVGMLAPLLGRDNHERGAAVRTVGPFWDGNEVWLVAGIGVTFAAFPAWYSALLAGLYLPMVAILLLLAVRGVALEFRGKVARPGGWDRALAVSSAGIVLLWGAVLGVLTDGLALGPGGDVAGSGLARSLAPLATPAAVVGALGALLAAVLLGATFLSLRTTGPVRSRARGVAVWLAFGGSFGVLGYGMVVQSRLVLACGVLLLGVGMVARAGREAVAFGVTALGVAGAVVAVFTVHGDVVLRSTVSAVYSLTRSGAAATDSALRLLTVVGAVVLPGVLAYQAFSYWVFRRRVASERIPS
jgi:cytochrome d ubiquinol oxidase subunit II